MSNSNLVTYTRITNNKNSPRNHAIDTITIHCYVGQVTAKQGCDYFATTDRQVSSNYVVGRDGSIGLSVDEKDRAWTSSSRENDHRAITIEVASDTKPPYAVTSAAYEALIKLVADICKRNGIKKLVWSTNSEDRVNHKNGCNMTVHRDFVATECPGDYLYKRHGEIAQRVNEMLGVKEEKVEQKFDIGDIVNFTGNRHYTTAGSSTGYACKAGKAKITNTYDGKHPYHLIAVDGGDVYGWVDAKDVSAIVEEKKIYRVRKSWDDADSQIGAYEDLNNAKEAKDKANPYHVYDWNGKEV